MATTYSASNTTGAGEFSCALHHIRVSTLNPRKLFAPEQLQELAESIALHGLLEAIVVRETANAMPADPGPFVFYEVVAGERRFRALWIVAMARCAGEPIAAFLALPEEERESYRAAAGFEEVPTRSLGVIDDAKHIELALVENLQRVDLDPIEEAEGYRQLNRVVGLSQAQIGQAVKRSQPAIANAMRLLDLPEDVRALISGGELSVSHGLALAKWKQWPEFVRGLAKLAVNEGWRTKKLERATPDLWDTKDARRVIDAYDTTFDKSVCAPCPFDARWDDSGGRGYCLQPSHYDQINTAAKRDKEKAEEFRDAELLATTKATGVMLPKVSEMGHSSYRNLDTIPAGCGDDCPCRTQALSYGDRPTVVCTNPKRFDKFQAEEKRAKAAQGRKVKAEKLALVEAAATAVGEATRRDLVLLVESLVSVMGSGSGQAPVLRDTLKHQGLALDAETLTGYHLGREQKRFRALYRLSDAQLLRLGVELVLRRDVENQFTEYRVGGHILDWYLRPVADDAATAEAGDDAS